MQKLIPGLLLFLGACGGGGHHPAPVPVPGQEWVIGPIIGGENYSKGLPLHPTPCPPALFCLDLPQQPGHIHAVTFHHGPLAGKTGIVMRGRIEIDPGARIVPLSEPAAPSMLTVYFQRRNDDWSGNGRYETFRFYAAFAMRTPIEPGEFTIEAPFSANWNAVRASNSYSAPEAFEGAMDDADEVGFCFGGGDGICHGAYVVGGTARIVIEGFSVE